ncbi:MAG: hypothetical protein RL223_4093, partial [Pseudomonadota bacterium]
MSQLSTAAEYRQIAQQLSLPAHAFVGGLPYQAAAGATFET